jgi:hypothetical protein
MSKKKAKVLIAFLCVLVAALVCVVVWMAMAPGDRPAQDDADSVAGDGLVVPERPDMIDVVAYESIELVAGETEQRVSLDNPIENGAWLRITLELDGGEVLWQSEKLQPGQVVRSITLARALDPGEYDAVLRYEHWTYDDEMKPLNGAETLLVLEVS